MTDADAAEYLKELIVFNKTGAMTTPKNDGFDTFYQCALEHAVRALLRESPAAPVEEKSAEDILDQRILYAFKQKHPCYREHMTTQQKACVIVNIRNILRDRTNKPDDQITDRDIYWAEQAAQTNIFMKNRMFFRR